MLNSINRASQTTSPRLGALEMGFVGCSIRIIQLRFVVKWEHKISKQKVWHRLYNKLNFHAVTGANALRSAGLLPGDGSDNDNLPHGMSPVQDVTSLADACVQGLIDSSSVLCYRTDLPGVKLELLRLKWSTKLWLLYRRCKGRAI
ncbi:hypothetical protein QCA50_004818 [Cerrena zonata]|uniref:Uncharacterized protein n=1 Tax=Cerrena zonata TaxID=2478898 RepID=A0AAW0GP93_9APHY